MENIFKYTLSFRLNFYDTFDDYESFIAPQKRSDFANFDDVQHEALRVIYNNMGLKLYSVAWADIELTPKNIKMLLEKFKELKEKDIAYPGAGHIYEEISGDAQWFKIWADHINTNDGDLVLGKGYPFSKAYQYPPHKHIQGDFVSEELKRFVQEELTGVDFLWAEDKGKYKARQWYVMVAKEAMGRGLDSPWFDEVLYRKFKTMIEPKAFIEKICNDGYGVDEESYLQSKILEDKLQFSDTYRIGVNYFDAVAIGDRLSNDKSLNELVNTFSVDGGRVNGLVISTVPRFLEDYLPQTDFAYYWDNVDRENERKWRTLCCNKKTKELLIEKGFIKKEDVSPLVIYNTLPKYCIDLANDTPCPEPVYTDTELKEYKKEEKIRRAKFDKKILPRRMPTMKSTLKLLRHRKNENGDKSVKGISQKKIDLIVGSMQIVLPKYWLDVLKISNGGEYWFEERLDSVFVPLQGLDAFHNDEVNNRKQDSDDYKETVTFFASTMTGDIYAFEKKPSKETEDAKVILISHEDFSIVKEWEGIADFLESILLGL